jgi:hypothetical protein
MPERRKLSVVSPAQKRSIDDLRDSVAAAQAAMPWLTDSDKALKALAVRMAAEIEETLDRAEELDAIYQDARGAQGGTEIYKRLAALEATCDVTKVVALIGPQLQAVLRDLGGTPAARLKLIEDKEPPSNRLQSLKADAKQR